MTDLNTDISLLDFLRVHQYRGQQLMLSRTVDDVKRLRDVLRQADSQLALLAAETPWQEFQQKLERLGFCPGWGRNAARTRETMRLLLDILEAPSPGNLEKFLSRIPMIFSMVIISPHGYFGQSNVLGRPDTGGQVVYILDQVRALEKELSALKGKLASAQGDELLAQAFDVKGLKVLAATLQGADAKTLRDTMDKLKDKLKSAAIVLAAVDGSKVQLAAGVTSDSVGRVKAGELVNFVAQQVGGKGGGKPDLAMAGGTDAAKLPQALASVRAWVAERL